MDKASSTNDNIINAALKLFSEKGYLGATTREISREAGVSEVTLFRHFPAKEKLLEEVIGKYSFIPVLKDLLSEIHDLSYRDALTLIAKRMLDFLVMRKDWIRIMQAEVQRSPESKLYGIFHGLMEELFTTLASYFRTMQEKGVLTDFDPAYGARAFHGIFFCYFNMEDLLRRDLYKTADRGKAISEFVTIFANGTER